MKFYNEAVESACTRILYFFNTIDTYFLLAGISSFLIVFHRQATVPAFLLALLFAVLTAKIADFYPTFLFLVFPGMMMLGKVLGPPAELLTPVFYIQIAIFFAVQFCFMGLPEVIITRDPRVPFIKMVNSLFTVAPTTVSFGMSVLFSFYLSFCLAVPLLCRTSEHYAWMGGGAAVFLISALITRATLPQNRFSRFHKLDTPDHPRFNRVVVLNIDGARKDVFDSLDLPHVARMAEEGAVHPAGLETVYRALTNPAFASIFTGTTPEYHGVRNNNFGQSIKTQGLPDLVKTVAYGSMHVKHFCKKEWETRIVSLPRHSIYRCDDVMVEELKEDMRTRPDVRLFIADFSEADLLAHAYGSTSKQYKKALVNIDRRIGDLVGWMRERGLLDGTAVIICSDHGIAGIDHSYKIMPSERFVPFIVCGEGIQKGFKIQRPGKIMDICCTICYLLGIPYPDHARGQVFSEILEGSDLSVQQDALVRRFNELKYDVEAKGYRHDRVEIYEGDAAWWDQCIKEFVGTKEVAVRVLDIGCGAGFVGERFVAAGTGLKEFVCVDSSGRMLEQAKEKFKGRAGFAFYTSLDEVQGEFDVVAVSSVFHHTADPAALAGVVDKYLAQGGIVIGAHEPNRKVFKNWAYSAAASLYKRAAGITMSDADVDEFNTLLAARYPRAPKVCREEILQMVEYHSPVEQYDTGIDKERGFVPEEFQRMCFPGYETLALETYSTFQYRPWLSRHRSIQSLLAGVYSLFFREGNLFRFVYRKQEG